MLEILGFNNISLSVRVCINKIFPPLYARIRSMRLAGAMLQETELANSSKGNQYTKELDSSEDVTSPTLSQLGITKNESSTYQKLKMIK